MLYRDFYPFYAAQGNPVFYNEEREQEREFDLMKSYYPDTEMTKDASAQEMPGGFLDDLIQVLVYQEISRRRCRRRRCRQYFPR